MATLIEQGDKENKLQLTRKEKSNGGKGKEIMASSTIKAKGKQKIIYDIDLDEEIVFPNWDQSNLFSKKIDRMGELWKKIAKREKMRVERDRRKVIEDIKDIFLDTLSIEVNEKVSIIEKLIEIVHKFNEDVNGQKKLLEKG